MPDKTKDESCDVGVIVGRFQVPELHEGHKNLIQSVIDKHDQVIIFLGVGRTRSTFNNPLDYPTRFHMITSEFPNTSITIHAMPDEHNDEVWSKNLDMKISEICPGKCAMLYGSRDSFIEHYKGNNKTVELDVKVFISGTEIRNSIRNQIINTKEFRIGVIHGVNDRYINSVPTVDVAVINYETDEILLARKYNESKYRLIGGFVDATDESYEAAAKRELYEEASININVDKFKYVTSMQVRDWRYENEKAKIITTCFMTKYLWGRVTPNDDICELRWFKIHDILPENIINTHIPLIKQIENKYLEEAVSQISD